MKNWINKTENKVILIGGAIALLGLLTPFIIMLIANKGFKLKNFNHLASVGDYFGGTTVGLLTLASMIFVIAAIVMQKEELSLQRQELQLTRSELEKTREEHALTNKTMKLQQFETTFFNMINLYNDILKDVYHPSRKVYGREAMKAHFEKINKSYFKYHVELFLHDYMANNSLDFVEKLKDYSEIIHGVIMYGNKTHEEFFISRVLDESITGDTVDVLYIHQNLSRIGKEHRQITYKLFDYSDFMLLSHMIPENRIVEEFMSKYVESDYYKHESFKSSVTEDGLMLSNYMKVVKMILELIDGQDSLSNSLTKEEKKKYMKIFFSQFSLYEITLLSYYMKLGGDHSLNYFQKEYSIVNIDEILEDSIIL